LTLCLLWCGVLFFFSRMIRLPSSGRVPCVRTFALPFFFYSPGVCVCVCLCVCVCVCVLCVYLCVCLCVCVCVCACMCVCEYLHMLLHIRLRPALHKKPKSMQKTETPNSKLEKLWLKFHAYLWCKIQFP